MLAKEAKYSVILVALLLKNEYLTWLLLAFNVIASYVARLLTLVPHATVTNECKTTCYSSRLGSFLYVRNIKCFVFLSSSLVFD